MATVAPVVVDVQPSEVGDGLSSRGVAVPVAQAVQVAPEPGTVGNDYVVAGAILPESNVAGNAPLRRNVTIELKGVKLQFEVRRKAACTRCARTHELAHAPVCAPALRPIATYNSYTQFVLS